MKSNHTFIRIDKDTRIRLKAQANQEGLPMTALIRVMLEERVQTTDSTIQYFQRRYGNPQQDMFPADFKMLTAGNPFN